MSSAELVFWQQSREFIGEDRDDYRIARLESAIVNFAGKTLAEGATVNPMDCMPYLRVTQRPRRWTRKAAAKQISSVFAQFREPGPDQKG